MASSRLVQACSSRAFMIYSPLSHKSFLFKDFCYKRGQGSLTCPRLTGPLRRHDVPLSDSVEPRPLSPSPGRGSSRSFVRLRPYGLLARPQAASLTLWVVSMLCRHSWAASTGMRILAL